MRKLFAQKVLFISALLTFVSVISGAFVEAQLYPTAPSFRFPVENYETSICFDWEGVRGSGLHVGQDVQCDSVGKQQVHATANGIVKFARPWGSVCLPEGNWGDVIVIEHTLPIWE